MPRVGVLSPAANEATPIFEAFRRGLHEFGYVEGRDIILEYRFAHGDATPFDGWRTNWRACRLTSS
jgi:putative tryptophan/tyrosine transport system substrate-binding protein